MQKENYYYYYYYYYYGLLLLTHRTCKEYREESAETRHPSTREVGSRQYKDGECVCM
jgi:hypothetical protein